MTFLRARSLLGVLAVACALLVGCAGARPSRWESRSPTSPKTLCTCKGVERSPTPSEASGEADERVVTMMCEGEVSDCREIRGHGRNLD